MIGKAKKAISVVMAALMALSIFTGCPQPQPKPPVEDDTAMTAAERNTAAENILALMDSNIIEDIDTLLKGEKADGVSLRSSVYKADEGTLEVTLPMSGYDLDGENGDKTATGSITITFKGEAGEEFNADEYDISSLSLNFKDGDKTAEIIISNVAGNLENGELTFTFKDGKATGISSDDIGKVTFGTPASGTVKMEGRIAVSIKEIVDAYIESQKPQELPEESIASVNALIKAAFGVMENLSTQTKQFTADGYAGTAELSVAEDSSWTLHVTADKAKATVHDIEFTVTSEDIENDNAVDVYISGIKYTAASADIADGIEIPSIFAWDVTARVAKHSRSGEDHDNYKAVTVSQDGDTITVSADTSKLVAFTSTDPEQAKLGDQKWFALLIGTGEEDITRIRYGEDYLPESEIAARNDMLGSDGSKAEEDEFVLWMYPENASRTITLGHDGVEDKTITISFVDTKPVFQWDVTARVAKHSRGESEDHGNYKAVTADLKDGTLTIKADTSEMTAFRSSDPEQAKLGNQKWFAVLIGTGEEDITKVSYAGEFLPSSEADARDDMLGADGSAVEKDEFVLWMYPENAERTIVLCHEDSEDEKINVVFDDIAPAFTWDVTARVAKHSREGEDHNNYKYIDAVLNGSTLEITGETGNMEAFTSSDPAQAEKGDMKWFALLIGTGENDITQVKYGSSYLDEAEITARGDMLAEDGTAASDDEFVLWLNAEEADGKKITLGHSGVSNTTITISFESVYNAPDADTVKADLTQFFGEFAKIQGWDHGTHNEVLYVDSEDLYGFNGWNQSVTAYLSFGGYNEDVETVSMLGKDFRADDTMQVSIGNNVFYRDKGWYLDENGNLMVNKVFMYATLAFDEDFAINDNAYEYTLGLESADKLSLVYDWAGAPYSSINPLGGDEYNVVVGATNKPLYSEYTGQSANDIILCVTDYGMREGSVTRQLALLTGEKSQFISYFYGWDTTMETIYNAYDRDIVDKSLVFKADGSVKGMYEATYHVTPAYVLDSQLQDVISYFEFPAHERILNRIGGVKGSAGGPITIGTHTYNAAEGTLAINVTFGDGTDGFEYQKEGIAGITGVKESHKAMGEIVFTFSGSADGDVFKADSWAISTDGLDIDGEHVFATDGFGGRISTDGGLGDTAGTVEFGLSAGDWDGTVKNPKEAKFSVALGLEGTALVDGKVLTADRFSDYI